MKVHTIATIEIKKSFKGVLKVSAFMALFVIMIASIFDPDLFAGMEEVFANYPDFIMEMVGGALDLGTFGGFYTLEFLSMIWIWLGIYFILQAGISFNDMDLAWNLFYPTSRARYTIHHRK